LNKQAEQWAVNVRHGYAVTNCRPWNSLDVPYIYRTKLDGVPVTKYAATRWSDNKQYAVLEQNGTREAKYALTINL
jgi:hypothetical protein